MTGDELLDYLRSHSPFRWVVVREGSPYGPVEHVTLDTLADLVERDLIDVRQISTSYWDDTPSHIRTEARLNVAPRDH